MVFGPLDYRRVSRNSAYEKAQQETSMTKEQQIDAKIIAAMAMLDSAANLSLKFRMPELRKRIEKHGKDLAVLSDELNADAKREKLRNAPGCIRAKETT